VQDLTQGTDLIDDRFENLTAQEVSRDRQFTIEKSDGRIIWVLYIETSKVEHFVCSLETKQR
jgi:hypothetical protein